MKDKDKELYLKGKKEDIKKVLEFSKQFIHKEGIYLVDILPEVVDYDEKCICGGRLSICCVDCGEEKDQ